MIKQLLDKKIYDIITKKNNTLFVQGHLKENFDLINDEDICYLEINTIDKENFCVIRYEKMRSECKISLLSLAILLINWGIGLKIEF